MCTVYDTNNIPPTCTPLTKITAIAAGYLHSLALDVDKQVWAWGSNSHGQLGNNNAGQFNVSSVAVKVCVTSEITSECSYFLDTATAIAAGQVHSLAIKEGDTIEENTVLTWGSNNVHQLGDNTNEANSPIPVPVVDDQQNSNSLLTDVDAITAGGWHSLALKRDDTVWSWGGNSQGQVGDNKGPGASWFAVPVCASGTTDPCPDNFFTDVDALADGVSGSHHSLVLKNGTVWGWGHNKWGQLGDGTTGDQLTGVRPTPVQVVPF